MYPLLGNLTSQYLGLTKDDYVKLCECIDTTIHSATSTNLLLPYKKAKKTNVLGVENIIDFVLKTKQKRGITCPKIDAKLLGTYIRKYAATGNIPLP